MQDFPLSPPARAYPSKHTEPPLAQTPNTVALEPAVYEPDVQQAECASILTQGPKIGSAQPSFNLAADPITQIQATQGPVLRIASPEDVKQAVDQALKLNLTEVPTRPGENRHSLNRRLQANTPYNGADLVIIAFEGTGAFHPRCAPVMVAANELLKQQGLTSQPGKCEIHTQLSEAMSKQEGKDMNWSGLAVGPLSTLLEDPQLAPSAQWLSFPSEEFEALSGGGAVQQATLRQILTEAVLSNEGETPGINQALNKLHEIRAQAKAQGKDPQFVIVSHSSGGRSAVKFLEKAKAIKDETGQMLRFPLVLTIDPVREAHEAVAEAGLELFNKGTEHNVNRVRGWIDALPLIEVEQKKVYPPLVRHRSQPESLYKPSNTGRFLSFYQRQDTEGLKMDPTFGIQGSPVKGAQNQEVHDVGSAGHGEIAYNPKVVKAFSEELQRLLAARAIQ
ncbi:MAG: hypothetical protein AB7I41_03255 [Candidatus Sericytochromatia bacterium]